MKRVFIVNPISGNGRSAKIAERIEKICRQKKIDYELLYTTGPGEATQIAERFKNEKCIIYSVGGDGTLNEILNGMVKSKNKLGIIPAGTGNDFYRTLVNYNDGDLPCDIGKINNRFFINIASIGLDAELSTNAIKLKHTIIPRKQVYNVSLIYTFFTYKFRDMEFVLDGVKKKNKFTIVTICNGTSYGSGFRIAPDAVINDGLFDICFVDQLPKIQIPKLVGLLKEGTHLNHPSCHLKRSTSIKMSCATEIPCQVDGETFYDKEFDVKIYKNLITLYLEKDFVKEMIGNL